MILNNRILVVVPFAFHRESGSSLSTYYRVIALSDFINEVDVITTAHGNDIKNSKINIIRSPKKPIFKNLEPGQYKKKLVYEFFLFWATVKLLFSKKYDFVIVHGSSIYWAFLIRIFFRPTFIATVHGNIQVELEKWNISKSSFLKKIAAKIENSIIKSFSHIIAEHKPVVDILVDSGIPLSKVTLIPIGVKSTESIVCENKSKDFVMLYTGTFVKVQNIELLYKSIALLKDSKIKLILIGGIQQEIEEEKKKIIAYGIQECVELVERVPQSELLQYYKRANIVVSPREFGHDTPMKVFDYMNFGKCILAVNRPIHTGILTPEVAFLAEPDPNSFAEAIKYIMQQPDLIKEKEKNAKLYFENNFEIKNMTKQYKQVLNF